MEGGGECLRLVGDWEEGEGCRVCRVQGALDKRPDFGPRIKEGWGVVGTREPTASRRNALSMNFRYGSGLTLSFWDVLAISGIEERGEVFIGLA